MKLIRWTSHALKNLADREIDRSEAEKTLDQPEFVVPGPFSRHIFMRRYFDILLQQEMLLRIVIKETMEEKIVVTVYKTSQTEKYLKEVL